MLRSSSLAAALLLAATAHLHAAPTLRGSRASMERQNRVAQAQDFTFLRTSGQVERFVDEGHLVPVEGNDDYELADVSYPYARPALRTFVERLAAQYRAACGERLVVTSLTRPRSEQPRNSHALSVHPAGMAVDLRVSSRPSCRAWLEDTLLSLERGEMLDVTRERRPPHYHVALFPDAYMAHVGRLLSDSLRTAAARAEAERLAAAERARLAGAAAPAAPRTASIAPAPTGESDAPRLAWMTLLGLAAAGAVIRRRRNRRAD